MPDAISVPNRRLVLFLFLAAGLIFFWPTGTMGQAPPPSWVSDGLLAYYPLDGDAKDYSGHEFNGFPTGVDFTAPGRQGGGSHSAGFCCGISGSTVIDLGSPGNGVLSDLLGLAQASITLWYLGSSDPTTYSDNNLLLYLADANDGSIDVSANSMSSLHFEVAGNQFSPHVPSNTWNALAIVYNYATSTVQYYINGWLVGRQSIIFPWPRAPISNLLLGRWFTGNISDVRFYNRALSSQEVGLLYNYELPLDERGPRVATAIPQIVNGFIVGADIIDGGAGYTNAPNVTILDKTGTGATASASVSNGVVTGISIITTGHQYSFSTTLVIDPPPFPPTQAKATAAVTNGFVIGVKVTNGGHDYGATPPPVYFLGGGGTGATGAASVSNGIVTGINIISTGSGYTNAPNVLIAVPPGFPTLSLVVSQVKVTMNLPVGYNYQVQTTTNLGGMWSNIGSMFLATESPITQMFDVTSVGQLFRVVEIP